MKNRGLARFIENRPLWCWLFWLYAAALTVALLWPNMTMPPVIERPDLVAHYIAFGLLALLMGLWNPLNTRRFAANALVTFAASAAYGAAAELLQAIPILKRSAGWDDWVADVLGVICGLIAYSAVRWLSASRSASTPR